jgi:RES domain-containing protein
MIVYRLSKSTYASDLSGKGAERTGGRWNSKGVPVIYTASSRALCTTEIAVHVPLGIVPVDFVLTTIEIPDKFIYTEPEMADLGPNWRTFPYSGATQKFGDQFVKGKEFLVMKVPSAVVQGDFNYLVNPLHEGIHEVKIIGSEPFVFDERLFKK